MVLGSVNEIKQYLDGRYIGPPEAAWRMFGHHMHEEVPAVVRLALHLPGMHRVNFNPTEPLEDIIVRTALERSTLSGLFNTIWVVLLVCFQPKLHPFYLSRISAILCLGQKK